MSFDKTFDGIAAHLMPADAAACVAFLRGYQEWRRWDGQRAGAYPSMPHPKSIGFAIDMAIRLIEQRDELLAAAEAIEINSDEVMDFDECTAMLIPMDDYHRLMEAIASAKAGA